MSNFNNQFATQKLRQEMSMTGGTANYVPGAGEQVPQRATKKVVKKKLKPEAKDVEPKLAAGKAKVYMKDKWGWKDSPSIPNRPSKGGFIYKQLFEELSQFVNELDSQDVNKSEAEENKPGFESGDEVKILPGSGWIRPGANVTGEIHDSLGKDADKDDLYSVYINAPGRPLKNIKGKYLQLINGHEELNESYSKFKNETKTRGKSEQFHQAIRQVRKKVQEINKLFEYVSRLKMELSEGEDGLKYKVHTEKALEKIKEMVLELNQNIKKFK